jgi:hypothetical protein
MNTADKALLAVLDRQFDSILRPQASKSYAQKRFDALPPHLKRQNIARWLRFKGEAWTHDKLLAIDEGHIIDLVELGDEAFIGRVVMEAFMTYGAEMMSDEEFGQ